jgi:hypothetical protein
MEVFRRRPVMVFVMAVTLLPAVASGQGLTGTLMGTVHDSNGGIIPGATVHVASPAVIGGERQTVSDEKGQWRLPALPPGTYALTVEHTSQFVVFREAKIEVGAGETVTRDATLRPAGIAESITVRPNSDLNTRESGIETRFGPDFIRSVPTRRYSMFSLINNTPGVSPTSPTSGSINTVSVFGSAVNENTFLIDGTNFTCPCQGVSRAEPIVDVIQELDVQSIGASVEFGNLQGGVFNVVTRQGGARVAGEASYYGQSSSLTAQPIVLPVSKGTQTSSGYERVRYRDLTTSLGGPVKRDRLWFFGAYQYLRDYDSQPGADPAFPRQYEQNKVFGKLNWQLTPSLHMMQSFHDEMWVNPTAPTLAAPFVTTQRVHASVPNMTFADVTHVLSNKTMWEARVGRFLLQQDADPASGDRTTPSHIDQITGISSGNTSQITTLHLDRITAKAVLHRYQSGWLGTDHEFKVGAQFERGEHRLLSIVPGGVRFVDNNTAPFQAMYRTPSIAGGAFVTPAVFASDTFTVTSRITVDAGVRYDHSRAINPDLPVVSADGRETDASIPGIGTVYTHDVVSPRLGFTAKLDRSARTVMRASYGRFNQGVLTGELDPISQGTTATTTMAYDPATGGFTHFVSVVDPRINLALDPHTRAPHTDEFSVALDREIAPRLRASAAYVGKRGSDFIAWVDRGGQYREDSRTVAGTTIPVFVLTNATADRRFFLTNPDDQFLAYDALVLALEKRQSAIWEASASYTYSRARGLQDLGNGTADDPQFSTIARPGFLTFGQDPNDLTNAAGRLPNDRPHVFRATTIVHLPWQGLLVSANLQSFSGKPWAASTQITLPQGSRRVLLEPRGTRRLSAQSLLDVRVSKTLVLGGSAKIDLLFDVLNLLNDTAEEALVSDNLLAATFGQPRAFIDPRRAMLGVRLNVGR